MNTNSHDDARDLEELRRLLSGPEREKLDQISDRLNNADHFASAVGEVLPQAMAKSAEHGEELSDAMIPTVEEIVRLSIKRDINKFADALFPVIGPAIRKSISETLRQMLQSLNKTLENSFSVQGIQWRLEAMRTSIPFANVVMLHSLVYRVDQVFLIHRETGLMLNHVSLEDSQNQDADMVSSMLTAIRDFVGDSFDVEKHQALDSVQVGDISLWIEQSPDVILALAIRGNAPNDLRTSMHQTLEDIQSRYASALEKFSGDTTALEPARELLLDCLQIQYKEPARIKLSLKTRLFLILTVLFLTYWFVFGMYISKQQENYLVLLENEPGYIVTNVDSDRNKMIVKGLRDPMSRESSELLTLSSLHTSDVSHQFDLYLSLESEFVNRRFLKSLNIPKSASAIIEENILRISGRVDSDWIRHVEIMSTNNEIISEVDLGDVVYFEEEKLLADIATLEHQTIYFEKATSYNHEASQLFEQVASLIKHIDKNADKLSRRVQIIVQGHTDSDGTYEENKILSLKRAEYVAKYFINIGITSKTLLIKGIEAPVQTETSQTERRNNRRVTFKAVITGDDNSGSNP